MDPVPFILAFLAGILVKLADSLEERHRLWPSLLPAILYGLLIGYLLSQSPFSMLFLAALFAQALAGKIDHHAHVIGLALAFLTAFYFGFPVSDAVFFVFLPLAYLDELELPGRWNMLGEYRVFLKAGALLFGFATGHWASFFGILAFDIGYLLIHFWRSPREAPFLPQI